MSEATHPTGGLTRRGFLKTTGAAAAGLACAGAVGAAIGGARNSSANVVINGGSVRATSARNGAAIGAGRDGAGGSVIINGGVVVAY